MVQQPQPYASEVIIYRTRSEFLTDLRIIIDGTTYPLRQLRAARVVRLSYYWPLQLLRLLAVGLAVVLLADVIGVFGIGTPISSPVLAVPLALVLLAWAVIVPSIVPTHAVQIETARDKARFFYSSDTEHLRDLVQHIEQATRRQKSG